MDRRLEIWFPDFFTEAHRTPEKGEYLRDCLGQVGVYCVAKPTKNCDLALCGSIWKSEETETTAAFYQLPVVHYNWDIYPWQVEGKAPECHEPNSWEPYIKRLKKCRGILVPSRCTVWRTTQYTDRCDAKVVKAPCHPWMPLFKSSQTPLPVGDKVVDVMRKYPDPNRYAVRDACKALGIPWVETGAEMPWDEYRQTIATARLLVSAYYECSTAGLSLLEGYWWGRPVLLADSPYNGGVDYFGDRAFYFKWDNRKDLMQQLDRLYHYPRQFDLHECREWLTREYSEQAFANRLARALREVLGG